MKVRLRNSDRILDIPVGGALAAHPVDTFELDYGDIEALMERTEFLQIMLLRLLPKHICHHKRLYSTT